MLALTEPWEGSLDLVGVLLALGAAVCWAGYIVLTQRAGDQVSGFNALAVSMPTAGIVATLVVAPTVGLPEITWQLVAHRARACRCCCPSSRSRWSCWRYVG